MTKPIDQDQLIELANALEFIEDPRVEGRVRHLLVDVLIISLCGILCGAEGIYEIELFGRAKESLIVQHGRNEWTAVKILANEKFSEKDLWSLTRLHERLPKSLKLNLIALTSTRATLGGVQCFPWESVV